jgi:TctA family transporter
MQVIEPNYRAVISTSWGGMLAVLLAMLMLSPLQYAMNGQYEALTLVLRDDPSPLGLQVLIVLLCLNAIVQVTVHARSCRIAKVCVLVLSVLYGLFFFAHNIVHMVGGEPLGLQSVLDFTHHALAGFAIWGAWRWQKAD